MNVRITGITHAKVLGGEQATRCGVWYVRNGQVAAVIHLEVAEHVDSPVDCMTCLVKDEWHNVDIREVLITRLANNVQEHVATMIALGKGSDK